MQDEASVSEKDEPWNLRRIGVLQSLALALARGGDHASAEERLLAAIGELQGLLVDKDSESDDDGVHKVGHRVLKLQT